MDHLNVAAVIVGILLSTLTIIGILAGWWWRWQRPRHEQAERRGETLEAIATVILGRPEVLDQSGEVALPAQPGVPARIDKLDSRLDGVESRLDDLGGKFESMKDDIHDRINHVERGLIAFGQRLNGLEDLVRGCPAHAATPAASASVSIHTPQPEEPKP